MANHSKSFFLAQLSILAYELGPQDYGKAEKYEAGSRGSRIPCIGPPSYEQDICVQSIRQFSGRGGEKLVTLLTVVMS